ncbi:MAG: DUF3604 domain-containing protein [Geminicoccaceae bacterium]
MFRNLLTTTAFVVLATPVLAQSNDGTTDAGTLNPDDVAYDKSDYSPFVDRHVPDTVFWGDTHVHSSYSFDAGFFGNTLPPEDAYRFARGEEVTSSTGQRIKLIRPLDFIVVADHAEYFGMADMMANGDPVIQEDEVTARWYKLRQGSQEESMQAFYEGVESVSTSNNLVKNPAMQRTAWDKTLAVAEQFNDPGNFSAIIGWEWSALPNGNNLHRVVMFRDGADRASEVVPFSAFDSNDPEDLWAFLQNYEDETGGRVLAIPHNGNWGTGLMFGLETISGEPLSKEYAETRMKWEPVYEVTQIKGDGEAHPALSPNDEFADFGTWDKGDIGGRNVITPEMLPGQYARSALKRGLEQDAALGANPFKFGMIGSSDSHTSLATTREDNYFGKNPPGEPAPDRWEHVFMQGVQDGTTYFNWETLASGLAGVWARENTREAIWDAFNRKEVYATTGSRITVRVFGGWDFTADEVERQDFADRGYEDGVPMGGELSNAPEGAAPRFMVRALRDPDNANLDRIQVIKGWLNADGEAEERIYDVVCSDDRAIVERRCEAPVGNTVDVTDATYTNTIGDPFMTAFWEDPDFDPARRAFYYVRVLEIPKPTWLAYDAARYGVEMPDEAPMFLQDRAYTSPIWYTPAS